MRWLTPPWSYTTVTALSLHLTMIGKTLSKMTIAATGLAPPNDLESAIVGTLMPGNYTAIVRGYNNATGNALVEVYGLD